MVVGRGARDARESEGEQVKTLILLAFGLCLWALVMGAVGRIVIVPQTEVSDAK
jgi:hypothetical protein